MATRAPDPDLFARQVESIRAQTHGDWVCYISDDASDPAAVADIEACLAGDPRFVLMRHDQRLGFYRNFERVLAMVPEDADAVALADQDDRWQPHKLQRLLDELEHAVLAYSDMRLVDVDGQVLASTYWSQRRPNHDDLGRLFVANSVTGAAAVFRSELLAVALPFPTPTTTSFHDHWVAVTARSVGAVSFVAEPLMDYTQHPGNVIGHAVRADGNGRFLGSVGLSGRAALRRQIERLDAIEQTDVRRLTMMASTILHRAADRVPSAERTVLERIRALNSSPASLAWLSARAATTLWDESVTMGGERRLVAAVLWHHLARRRR